MESETPNKITKCNECILIRSKHIDNIHNLKNIS